MDCGRSQRGGSSAAHINQVLSQPAAERTVATIVHEATHQLAYNTGLQTRYAGNPMWVSEGIAVYFETPDLDSARGWRYIGAINRLHLNHFREYAQSASARCAGDPADRRCPVPRSEDVGRRLRRGLGAELLPAARPAGAVRQVPAGDGAVAAVGGTDERGTPRAVSTGPSARTWRASTRTSCGTCASRECRGS